MTIRVIAPEPGFIKELVDVAHIFLPNASLVEGEGEPGLFIEITEKDSIGGTVAEAALSGAFAAMHALPVEPSGTPLEKKRLRKRAHKLALYHALKAATGVQPAWGSLTGVRPTRLVYERMEAGHPLTDAVAQVRDLFDLTPGKAGLLEEVILRQATLPAPREDEFSVYVGVPFCVSRCRYCSFVSRVTRDGALLDAYTDALCGEVAGTAALAQGLGLRARAVYFGGGTPTALGERRLRRVLEAARPLTAQSREVTVEAGRPDTLDMPMLRMLRDEGAGRLCVNPQTMDDATLSRIGRAHTAAQTEEAYAMARAAGFTHVNMDLIAGLPGEDEETFRRSLSRVLDLSPESVTVHALCVKRSSDMHRLGDALPDGAAAQNMVDAARAETAARGYAPYYLYRQKHMAGNQENVGYAMPGHECLYNVDMMEDAVTVLAAGAGAISRRVWPGRNRIVRAPNVKDIAHYIARVGEMMERKEELMRMGAGEGADEAEDGAE
ncbi:MAG TPA: coproporphyrinogen dehydrogenase HemZ [Candidatus Limnocylindria bacterium]|nr:coproporphyrinogen dehydrogenase HemZ [Candidatus Limnocylindria bacterium]